MNFGLLPDRPDPRDAFMRSFLRFRSADLPDYIDLRKGLFEPVRDQGDEGICVGMAASAMKEFQEAQDCGADEYLSPRYIYAGAKKIDGYPNEEGTSLRDAMKVLAGRGVCLEATWPYVSRKPGKPEPWADDEAFGFRINSYAKITTILDAEKALVENGPFCAGIDVWPGWMDVGDEGIIPNPPRSYQSIGGHAVLICGYDREKELFLVRNSWGQNWGDNGYAWISYSHIRRCLVSAWSSVDMPGSLLPQKEEVVL